MHVVITESCTDDEALLKNLEAKGVVPTTWTVHHNPAPFSLCVRPFHAVHHHLLDLKAENPRGNIIQPAVVVCNGDGEVRWWQSARTFGVGDGDEARYIPAFGSGALLPDGQPAPLVPFTCARTDLQDALAASRSGRHAALRFVDSPGCRKTCLGLLRKEDQQARDAA